MRGRTTSTDWAVALLIASAAGGCAGSQEQTVRSELTTAAGQFSERTPQERDAPSPRLDGRLESYVAFAMRNSPELRASFEQWRTAVLRVSGARRLPNPTLSYGYFVRSVETRVGPQRHRLGIRQMFPWPTKLTAGADAASLRARAAQRRFEAQAIALESRIARLYWQLWLLDRVHGISLEQEAVLETLERTIEGRVESGEATLADLLQVQLTLTRHRDHHAAHREAIRRTRAELVAAIGAPPGTHTPVDADAPPGGLPEQSEQELLQAALEHPRVETHEWLARSSEAAARREHAERLPSFGVGLEWIETGPARQPGVSDSGKDPVILNVMLELPLWQRNYGEAVEASRAEQAAHLAEAEAAERDAQAALQAALADVRDAERRIQLYEGTLVPQAETVHESLRGTYQAGRGSIAQLLLSERRLFELREELARARADHAIAWARLENVVGRQVERTDAPPLVDAEHHR